VRSLQADPSGVVGTSLRELRATFVETIPKVVTAVLFLIAAYVGITLAMGLVRSSLDRLYDGDDDLIADLFATVVSVFLWFGVVLALLKILGVGDIAASLGSATGFLALGVSYALSNMLADTVAGVYRLRDPDFSLGDSVVTSDVTGTVLNVELRKTRFESESGDVVVVANSAVEMKWTKKVETDGSAEASAPDGPAGSS
jgi:small-conductance mechanosensitive channel